MLLRPFSTDLIIQLFFTKNKLYFHVFTTEIVNTISIIFYSASYYPNISIEFTKKSNSTNYFTIFQLYKLLITNKIHDKKNKY